MAPAALATNNNEKVQAQNWFLKAANNAGVNQFLAFYNSPPVSLTKNNKHLLTAVFAI
jgi:hypothetical protein